MSDWQAGDLALCVKAGKLTCRHGWVFCGLDAAPVGTLITVADVRPTRNTRNGRPAESCGCIVLRGLGGGGHAGRFRKVTPPAADEWDRETIALMKGVRVGEPA